MAEGKEPKEKKKSGPIPVSQNKLDAAGIDAILELIVEGWTYRQIAAKYEVGVARLCAWFAADTERSHACMRAREASAQAHEEAAEEEIVNAQDQFELSKAKELAIHRRWRAKMVNPRMYGERQQIDVNDITPKSQEEVDADLAKLIAKAAGNGKR